MRDLIARARRGDVERALGRTGCALLVGARQVGKTEFARMLEAEHGNSATYFDLEQPNQSAAVADLTAFHDQNRGKLIILDEAQCAPHLFPQLRAILDRRDPEADRTRWLLLGSAAAELTSLAVQLGGRIAVIELFGFQLPEVAIESAPTLKAANVDDVAQQAEQIVPSADRFDTQQRLWLRGGYPRAYLSNDISESLDWRRDYLIAFLDPEWIPNGLLQRPELVRPMWEHLAVNHGMPMIMQNTTKRLGCNKAVADEILSYLSRMKLVFALPGWHPNEGKRADLPKLYFIRDSGLLHQNWGFPSVTAILSHSVCGKSWEGFVLSALMECCQYKAKLFYYKNKYQNEVDIVADFGTDRRWAIEVKLGNDTAPKAGFHAASAELVPEKAFVINGGRESIDPDNGKIPILCLSDALDVFR